MAWVRISDDFYDHTKFIEAGPLGTALWAVSLAWCNRNLTDGFIPSTKVRTLIDLDGIAIDFAEHMGEVVGGRPVEVDDVADLLVRCGLWEKAEEGYQIHDYREYQPTRARVLADREKERLRWERRSISDSTPEVAPTRREGGDADNSAPTPRRSARGDPPDSAPTPDVPNPNPNPSTTHTPVLPPGSPTPAASSEPAFAADFEALWASYPRKIEKRAAYRAYVATRRRKVAARDLLDATAAFATAMAADARPLDKIKHGSTFFGPDEPWRDWLAGGPAREEAGRLAADANPQLAAGLALPWDGDA